MNASRRAQPLARSNDHVVDHLRNFDRDVDAGDGDGIHHGWVHSPIAGIGGRSCVGTAHHRPFNRVRQTSGNPRALEFSSRPPGYLMFVLRD